MNQNLRIAPPSDAADAANALKVLCHVILSRWADRHDVTFDPVALADLFREFGVDDQARIEAAVASFTQAGTMPPRTASTPNETPAPTDTSRAILEAARAAFLESGYDVSLDHIARVAGVTKPTIYSYFKGRQELFREAMLSNADALAPVAIMPDPAGDLRTELLRFTRSVRELVLAENSLKAYRIAIIHFHEAPDIGRLTAEKTMTRVVEALTDFFRKAIALGRIRETDPAMLAECLFAASAGLTKNKILMGMEPDEAAHGEAYLEVLIDALLTGIALDPER